MKKVISVLIFSLGFLAVKAQDTDNNKINIMFILADDLGWADAILYGKTKLYETHNQELPAVYPISALNNLYSYFGDKPFTGAPLSKPKVVNLRSGFWGKYKNNMVTENWMAFVNDDLWGMGVYTPTCSNFLAGMAKDPGYEAYDSATSYIAPINKATLNKDTVYEFDYYLIIGNLRVIREDVYDLNKSIKSK